MAKFSFNLKRSNMSFEAAKKVMGAQKLGFSSLPNTNKKVDAEGNILPTFIFMNIIDEDGVEQRMGNASINLRKKVGDEKDPVEAMLQKNVVISELINEEDGSTTFVAHEESANKLENHWV